MPANVLSPPAAYPPHLSLGLILVIDLALWLIIAAGILAVA